MLEGIFGSIVGKAVFSLVASFGLFGGLAVMGVLPVLGDNASDTVAIDALALVDTPDRVVGLNPYVELPSVGGIASQLPVVDELSASIPVADGVTTTTGEVDSGLPVLGLVGTLLNSVTGTVNAVLGSLPVVGGAVPGLPLEGEFVIPTVADSSPGLELIDGTLSSLPETISSVQSSGADDVGSLTNGVPLVDDLLRTAQGAVAGLLPSLALFVE
ncbi:MAG TPA: hypothetical protein VHI31_08865 [Actinomycetota bacterium]|nr:hypothetical protein [Actinomycetota bacterium]